MASESQPPVESADVHCTDVERFLRIIQPDGVYEIRVIDCPDRPGGSYVSTASGYFNDAAVAAKAIKQLESLEPPAIYLTVNPVANALLARAANRIVHRSKKTTAKPDVVRRRWLFIDIDAKRPSGISSTVDELAAAMELAETLLGAMRAEGWPEPLRGMSGNGAYLFWRIDLANDDDAESLIKRVLIAMADRFNTDGAEVDLTPFDANRICKVLGTTARKGDQLVGVAGEPDRPHRQSRFTDPGDELEPVTCDQLIAVAESIEDPEPAKQTKPSPVMRVPGWDVDRWLRDHNVPVANPLPYQGGRKWLFTDLPKCCETHGHGFDGSSCIIERADGMMGASCHHNHCDWGWRELRLAYEPDAFARENVDISGIVNGSSPNNDDGAGAKVEPEPVADEWDDPMEIDRPDLPSFPVHVLPEPLRAWVTATAEATQTPKDLAGLLALAICAGAVARRVEIEAGRGYVEPLNLYIAVLLDPANRKSSVFRSATAPLRSIEAELIETAGPGIARALSDRRMREAALKKCEAKAAGGDEAARAEALGLAEELAIEPVPSMPRLLVDDATAEAVEMALAAQGGRLVVAGAEGGLFDVMGGRYAGGAANLDCFLKGHAGDDLRVDRVSRGTLIVDRVCLTLCYAVQPEVLRGMASQKAFRGRGLIGRFLYAIPESPLGSRRIDPEPVRDDVAKHYENVVRRLAEIPERFDGPGVLAMSPAAATAFKAWATEVEAWLGDDGRLATMRDWGGKLVGLTARLAGVIHLVHEIDAPDPVAVAIDVDVIKAAIVMARWAVDHATAAIGLMAADDGSLDDASYVLRFLRHRAEPEVSRRDVAQHGRARFDGDQARLDRALAVLVDRGWLRVITDDRPAPGRPSVRYRCHPSIAAEAVQLDRATVPPWESSDRVTGVI